MYLKNYQRFNKFYSFDPPTGHAQPVAKPEVGFCGYLATLADGQVAGLYKQRGQLTLQLGQQKWVYNPAMQSTHQHIEGGKTVFALYQEGKRLMKYTYPSWWLGKDSYLSPALGELADDEEDDFLGYVHNVFEDEKKGIKRAATWHDAE
jgi:hypothetical protein